MQFDFDGEYYSVSRITGPRHNALFMSLSHTKQTGAPVLEVMPPVGGCHHAPLDGEKILVEVLEGIREANAKFGTQYIAIRVRYVQNDTPPATVYRYLAIKLVEYAEENPQPNERKSE